MSPDVLPKSHWGHLIPHQGAMCLLDRIEDYGADWVRAGIDVDGRSLFENADGAVPSWLGIEYMAQAVAAHAGYGARLRGEPVRVGFLLGTRRYACTVSAFPVGSVLHVQVQRMLQGENGLGAYECRIVDGAGGAEWASATITVF